MSRRGSGRSADNDYAVNKYSLARKKFRKYFCRVCGLCGDSATMRFCFNNLYQGDPVAFVDTVFPLIKRNKIKLKTLTEQLLVPDFQDLHLFRSTICMGGCCPECCGDLTNDVRSCYSSFCAQVNSSARRSAIRSDKHNTGKIKSEPEMFFAAYGSDTFQEDIANILEDYAASK